MNPSVMMATNAAAPTIIIFTKSECIGC
jgi:hypothetical protein